MAEVAENPVTEETAVIEETVAELVVETEAENVEVENVEAETADPVFAEVEFDMSKKKKKVWLPILITVLAVIAAAAVAVAIFFTEIQGFFLKNFGSAEDYFKYVELQELKNSTHDITDYYGKVVDSFGKDSASEGKIKLNVSDEVLDLAKNYVGPDMNLDWLKNIAINQKINVKDDVYLSETGLEISGKTIVDLTTIANMSKQEFYVAILSLSDKYLKLEAGNNAAAIDYQKFLYDDEFLKALPSDDELDKILDKYLEIVVDELNDVEKSKDTLEIGGIEQDVVVLEFNLDTKTAIKIAKNVLKEAKNDKDIKKQLDSIAKYLKKEGLLESTNELYGGYKEGIEDLLDEINELDYENEDVVTIIDYVDKSHKIVGRTIEVKGIEIFYYATAKDGDDFASELVCRNFVIKGEGTEVKGVVNAKYTVTVATKEYATISVTDYDDSKIKDGILSGKISVKPTKEALKLAIPDSSVLSAIELLDLGLELDFASTEETEKLSVNVISKDKTFFGITIEVTETEPQKVSLPERDKTMDSTMADEWASELDLTKITAALKEAGIPIDLIMDMAEEYIYGPSIPDYSYGDGYYGDNGYGGLEYDFDYAG